MRPPFLRPRASRDAYAILVSGVLASVLPVPELLRQSGVTLGRVEAGRAHAVELAEVSRHLAALAGVEQGLERVRPPGEAAALHRRLRRLLAAYRSTMARYASVCAAVRDADVDAYREHNAQGRELDARACEATAATLEALKEAGLDVDAPPLLRRVVEKGEAYRRVAGGAFAFWE